MGCDIHFFVEKKNSQGVWESADKWTTTKYEGEEDYFGVEWEDRVFYNGRNYALFSILANVRNGYGFAGCDTGDGFVPISPEKGIPEDACPEYLRMCEQWEGDGHSHSYFTVQELKDYDWNQKTKIRGFIDLKSWVKWKKEANSINTPYFGSYCGGVDGVNILKIPGFHAMKIYSNFPDNAEAKIQDLYPGKSIYIHSEWGEVYHECAGEFYTKTIPMLEELSEGDLQSVRIVFFFDN